MFVFPVLSKCFTRQLSPVIAVDDGLACSTVMGPDGSDMLEALPGDVVRGVDVCSSRERSVLAEDSVDCCTVTSLVVLVVVFLFSVGATWIVVELLPDVAVSRMDRFKQKTLSTLCWWNIKGDKFWGKEVVQNIRSGLMQADMISSAKVGCKNQMRHLQWRTKKHSPSCSHCVGSSGLSVSQFIPSAQWGFLLYVNAKVSNCSSTFNQHKVEQRSVESTL